ncbi:unnamed protein product [Coffea canephora]|uniref:Transcription factor CBF/NF-Y/archaeal histone domain-containing protein n=1 Tax=Coffea canephora TaxID=49390 RepID=A0A068UG11_COFCA|nr:unnamed protein product [Coffea canephora]
MVGKRSISNGTRSKKLSKPENPSAPKRKNRDEEEEKEEQEVLILESSSSKPERGKKVVTKKAKKGAKEDSDDEDIRLLFEEKVASQIAAKEWGKIGKSGLMKNKKSGGAGSSSTPKEVEKKKSQGKKKAVAEEEEREQESSGKKEMKNSKKKKNMVAVEEGDDENEREEGPQCKFPMNRIQKIMKDHDASARLAQEAIFLANKASEKFLELYCREAYACAFLDHKKQVSYDHLASVVSKRKRFDFLSDIIPQRVKAEDALAEVSDK